MNEREIKEKVLQEIMDMMDEKSVEGLKSKSPKFAKKEEPIEEESLKDKLLGSDEEEETEELAPEELKKEDDTEEEDVERLKEMYSRLK